MRIRNFDDYFSVDKTGSIASLISGSAPRAFSKSVISANLTTWDGPSGHQDSGTLDGTEGTAKGDFIAVVLTAGVTYSFAERPTVVGGIEDPWMAIVNSSGNILVSDDDGGAGRSSLLTFTPTVGGTYYVFASSWVNLFSTGGDTGGYTIDQWTPATTADAPSTISGAPEIHVGDTTFGHIAAAQDVDVYKIVLTAGDYYTFNYSGGADGSTAIGTAGESIAFLDLLDSAGNVVATGLNFESGIGYLAETSGTFYVRASSYGGTTGGYTLDVSAVDPATKNPLDAIDWHDAETIIPDLADTDGDGIGDTAYIYFAPAGEGFGEFEDDGETAITTYGWQPYQIDGVLNALNTNYSPITNIHYAATTDVTEATFRLITSHSEVYGARFYPQDPGYGTQQGIGTFNLLSGGFGTAGLERTMDRGGFSYAVVLHEFGHAHGLAHPHDNGGSSEIMLGVNGSDSRGIYDLNQGVYTVMSYNDGWQTNPDGAQPFTRATIGYGWSGSLGAFDIAQLQARYGVHAANTGDDVYTIFDTEGSGAFYQTIWDTGGTDAIVYNGDRNAQIDLLAATLDYSPTGGGVVSFAHGVHGGFTIANTVEIENASGGGGNDILLGNALVNTLDGNGGNDVLIGRLGDDLLNGGLGSDTASYQNAGGSVTVNIASGASGADGNDTFTGIENATGSRYNDILNGDGNANILDGGDGDDMMSGGAGSDTASYASVSAGVNVSLLLQGGQQNTGGGGLDTLSGFENLTGSRFNDRLIGDANANVIAGGNGFDVVTLGGGADTFLAEVGAAKMSLKSGTMSVDVITDFTTGQDQIDVDALGNFHFRGTANNSRMGDLTYKVYDSVNGAENALGIDIDGSSGKGANVPVTVVYGNTDGGSADFAIILLNHNGVSSADFHF